MKRIPFPIIIISVFAAALGVIDILLASLSTEDTNTTDGEDNWNMLFLAYVVAAVCMMDEDMEHDDNEETWKGQQNIVVLNMTIHKQRLLCGMTTCCRIHCLMTSSSSNFCV